MQRDPPSRVRSTIDLDAPGRRPGFLVVPWSRNDSAWGSVRIPITVIRGGRGPPCCHRRQSWRRIRRAARAVQAGRAAQAGNAARPGHPAADHEPSGGPCGDPPLADRRPQHEPQLSRAAGMAPSPRSSATTSFASWSPVPTSWSTCIPAAGRSTSCHRSACTSSRTGPDGPHRGGNCAASARRWHWSSRSSTPRACWTPRSSRLGKLFVTTELGGGGSCTPRTVDIGRARRRQPAAPLRAARRRAAARSAADPLHAHA